MQTTQDTTHKGAIHDKEANQSSNQTHQNTKGDTMPTRDSTITADTTRDTSTTPNTSSKDNTQQGSTLQSPTTHSTDSNAQQGSGESSQATQADTNTHLSYHFFEEGGGCISYPQFEQL